MPALIPPFEGKPVHVGDNLLDRYLALGYQRAEESKPVVVQEPVRPAPRRRRATD